MQKQPFCSRAAVRAAVSHRTLKPAAPVRGHAGQIVEFLESRRLMSSVLQPFDAGSADPLAQAGTGGDFAALVGPFATPPIEAPAAADAPKAAKPAVSLIASATSAAAPSVVTLTASVSDADGSVARVDFYRGSKKLGSDTEAPFTWSIDDVDKGSYSYSAKAVDDAGLSARSNVVNLKIAAALSNPTPEPDPAPTPAPEPTPESAPDPTPTGEGEAPTVSLVNPVSGKYAGPGYWALRADASDADGTVTRVDFVANGNVIASTTAKPFLAAWKDVAPGTYEVTAIAYDDDGNRTTSETVKVTVEEPGDGRTIHVGKDGSSDGSGSAESPVASINQAMSMASAGDTVLAAPGTYDEEVTVSHGGTRQKPIVLKAEEPGTVVIDGGGNRSTLLAPQSKSSGKYVWVSGLTFRNADNGPGGYQAAVRTSSGWRVEDCLIEKVKGNGLGFFGDNVLVRDVLAQDNGVSGISGSSLHESLLLDSVTRHNNLNVQTSEGGGGKITRSNGLLVDNLEAAENNGPGFWFDIDNINCVVRNSTFHDNVTLKKSDGSDRITGRGLFLEISGVDSDGNGEAIDAGPLLVEDNLTHDNGSAGITVYATGNAHLRGNTIVNDGIELKDRRPAPYSIHDLTIEGNSFKNAMINADGATISNYKSRHYLIDGNTYDNGDHGSAISWSGRKYGSPSSVFDALGFEKTGRVGEVNVALPA